MALNLWKIGGSPISFNPLPTGFGAAGSNRITIGIGDFVLRFKAKSPSGTRIRPDMASQNEYDTNVFLTNEFKYYEFNFYSKQLQGFWIYDTDSKGDIIIEDIQLVQKPLPKLTINGIDGFNSGKWTLHANAKVIDDETLELNALTANQWSELIVNVTPYTNYTLNVEHDGRVGVVDLSQANVLVAWTANKTNVFNSGQYSKIKVWLGTNAPTGKFTFKKPMLNLGTTLAPYEPKRGERMVLPSVKGNLVNNDGSMWEQGTYFNGGKTEHAGRVRFRDFIPVKPNTSYACSINPLYRLAVHQMSASKTYISDTGWQLNGYVFTTSANTYYIEIPVSRIDDAVVNPTIVSDIKIQIVQGTQPTPYEPYAVQLNKKPKRYVPKKNLFNKATIKSGYISALSNGNENVSSGKFVSDFIPISTGKAYYKSTNQSFVYFKSDRTFHSSSAGASSFIVPDGAYYVRLNSDDMYLDTLQLEEGQPTPYEPYQLVLPRAKSGSAFNGTTDYFQLPSMTMDSIEIECLIDSVQPQVTQVLLDARGGLAFSYFSSNLGVGSGWNSLTVDGIIKPSKIWSDIPKNQRTKIKLSANNPFTDDATIFRNGAVVSDYLKGTLYKVTCYLNGQVVATYDFENPQNIVGDKVIPNAKNLIPSFDDSRWSLHANFKVLGKDVGRLDATAVNQSSVIAVDVKPSTPYSFYLNHHGRVAIRRDSETGSALSFQDNSTSLKNTILTFTTPSDVSKVWVKIDNNALSSGSFDFIKPQLYELSGKEGTIVGKPKQNIKPAKRQLDSKR